MPARNVRHVSRICEDPQCKHFRSEHPSGGACKLCDCQKFQFTVVERSKRKMLAPLTDDEVQRCLDMLREGATYAEVAHVSGRCTSTLRGRFPGFSQSPRQRALNHDNRARLLEMWTDSRERYEARKKVCEEENKAAGYNPVNWPEIVNGGGQE